MDAYIYKAEQYCPTCTEQIKAALDHSGLAPADPADERSYDSDDYPKGPYANGGGESDTPQHCGCCGVALGNDLTEDGVAYVIEFLLDYLGGIRSGNGAELEDEWAAQLKDYRLTVEQKDTLELYCNLRAIEKETPC